MAFMSREGWRTPNMFSEVPFFRLLTCGFYIAPERRTTKDNVRNRTTRKFIWIPSQIRKAHEQTIIVTRPGDRRKLKTD